MLDLPDHWMITAAFFILFAGIFMTIMMACLCRRRNFKCCGVTQNTEATVESYRPRNNREYNDSRQETVAALPASMSQVQDQHARANFVSITTDQTQAQVQNQGGTADISSPSHLSPPPYSSLFYCPPPNYEDAVQT